MLGNQHVAARIDRAEASLTRDVAAGVAANGANGVVVARFAGGVAAFVRSRSPINKIMKSSTLAPMISPHGGTSRSQESSAWLLHTRAVLTKDLR